MERETGQDRPFSCKPREARSQTTGVATPKRDGRFSGRRLFY